MNSEKKYFYTCKVCGYQDYYYEPPWGENDCCPSFGYCICCGVEYGNGDWTIESAKNFREKWIKSGAEFWEKDKEPPNWNLEEQLKNIPEKYR